jgi:PAS domain S-box-containing protein
MAEREEKKEYEEIIKSRDFLQSVLENMTDGVLVADMQGVITHINKTMSEMVGYSPQEMIGRHTTILQAVENDTQTPIKREIILKELMERGTATRRHDTYRAKDGRLIPVDIHITLLKDQANRPIGSIAVIRDISQRLKLEKELKENSEFIENVMETSVDGIIITDATAKILRVNQATLEILGYSKDEIVGRYTMEIFPFQQSERSRYMEMFHELFEKGKKIGHEYSWTKRDGMVYHLDLNYSLVRDSSGMPRFVVALIRDISQKKEMEKALKESEGRFRNLVEMANDGIIMGDRERNIILFNRKAEEIYGYKREEVIGKNVEILVPPRYRGLEREWYNVVLKIGASPILEKPVEMEGLRKDGSEIPLEYSFSMYREEKGFFSMAVVRDITERKKLEREIIEKEKLSALMELAGATAHELNQPLTTILGAAEMIMRKTKEKDPQFRQLSLIAKETKRLASMIKKIRKVIRYETKPYLGEVKIIDLEKATKTRGKE